MTQNDKLHASPLLTVDVIVIGAGFAGMYMLHKLRGLGLSAKVLDAAQDVGGAWYWNRYPGARCDIESIEYSYSFSSELQQEWRWTERYATQAEILRYAKHVAERFDLRRDIIFDTQVVAANFDDVHSRWQVQSRCGACYDSRFLIMATGGLSVPYQPELIGSSDFKGTQYHTARWPDEPVSFSGKRVAVIGTGSSGIQTIPIIAREAEHVFVFQRTPNFSIPARNAKLTSQFMQWVKENYPSIRTKARKIGLGMVDLPTEECKKVDPATRKQRFESLWKKGGTAFLFAFRDLKTDIEANDMAISFVHDKIRQIVQDPVVATTLMPTDHPLGTKRICVDTDYYATFNRSNVTLIDARNTPIQTLLPHGIRTSIQDYQVDTIIYATGFDALTGALRAIDIRGKAGCSLREKWKVAPCTYLGIATADFPNLFMINGPGSPSVLSNALLSIEQHVEWLTDLLAYAQRHDIMSIDVLHEAESSWVEHVNTVAATTLYPLANSWYLGANIPGKPRVFIPYAGGVDVYRTRCNEIANNGYEGFSLYTKVNWDKHRGSPIRD